MQLNWTITDKHPETGCVEVLWRDEATGDTYGPFNVNVLDAAGACLEGEALIQRINASTPSFEAERQRHVEALPTDAMRHIDSLLNVEQKGSPPVEPNTGRAQPVPTPRAPTSMAPAQPARTRIENV